METEKNSRAQELLSEALRMTASMAGEENTSSLLRQGLLLCIKTLDCERGLLISLKEGSLPQVLQREGADDGHDPFSSTALRLVNEQQKPLLIHDTVGDQTFSVQESIARLDIRSILCARLDGVEAMFPDQRVYLYFDSHTNRRPFTDNDLEIFRLLIALMSGLVRKSDLLARQEATISELQSRAVEQQFEDLVFASASFGKTITLVKQAAPTDVPILLIGETGTGKEVLARIVHTSSKRSGQSFLAVNCGAIPSSLIESELFGHEKGAFTGAVAPKKGYFEEASGGTLFLDEIGELPAQVQSSLLRVLQEHEVTRVGASRPVNVDVRIIAATNVDLNKSVLEGTFRKDLFFRLNVIMVTVPPVRERGEDALVLARYFLRRYCESFGTPPRTFSRDAEKALLMYGWPGNVREIQNRVQRAVITSPGPVVSKDDLALEEQTMSEPTTLALAREKVDREMIARALSRSPGNLTTAGKILDIDRKSLRLLCEKYGIVY